MIPFITSRTSTWRLLPPRLAGGIKGSTCAHSSSVRSLGYRNLLRSSRPRFFAVHIGGAPLESGHHFESQMIQRIQNVFGRTLSETYQTNIAPFFDSHAILHLSALEQIRLGALPYVEAQTQYGFGDQLLMGVLTSAINYSAHGFYEAQMVVNALSIILFFVAIYYFIGFGWALLGLVGYSFLPSSWWVATFPGWAILSRWVGVGILGLVLAHVLLAPAWTQRRWLGV